MGQAAGNNRYGTRINMDGISSPSPASIGRSNHNFIDSIRDNNGVCGGTCSPVIGIINRRAVYPNSINHIRTNIRMKGTNGWWRQIKSIYLDIQNNSSGVYRTSIINSPECYSIDSIIYLMGNNLNSYVCIIRGGIADDRKARHIAPCSIMGNLI